MLTLRTLIRRKSFIWTFSYIIVLPILGWIGLWAGMLRAFEMIYNYCINYRKLEASFTVSLLWKMKTTMASFRLLLQKWHLWPIYKNWFHIVNLVSRENFILGLSTHNIFVKRASYASSKSIQVVRQNILKIRENFVHRCMPMSTLLTKPLFKTLTGIVFPCAFFLLLNCDKTSYIKNPEMVDVITQIELVSYV